MPAWLTIAAWISIAAGVVCAAAIVLDEIRHPQPMWIMNVVWPMTALYASLLALWAYFRIGKAAEHAHGRHASHQERQQQHSERAAMPDWQAIAKATTHCGAGCTLGDLCAEWIMWNAPWQLWGQKMFGAWVVDFGFAFILGIGFQYFTIVPMKKFTPAQGILASLKADTASLCAWQIGMYGWMAIARFVIFQRDLTATSPVFWLMMQLAMLIGFVTALPVNAWLLRKGIKEAM